MRKLIFDEKKKPRLDIVIDDADYVIVDTDQILSNEEQIDSARIKRNEPMTERKNTSRFNFSHLKKPSQLTSKKSSPIKKKNTGMLTTRHNTTKLTEVLDEQIPTTR